MNVLVTGGAGFIGSNFVRYFLKKYPAYRIINLDKLTYAGNLENLTDVQSNPKYTFEKADICNKARVTEIVTKHGIDSIIHFAAESHVDRSILGATEFVQANIVGTNVLLEVAKEQNIQKYLQVSTDEVYGSLDRYRKIYRRNAVASQQSVFCK